MYTYTKYTYMYEYVLLCYCKYRYWLPLNKGRKFSFNSQSFRNSPINKYY